MRIAYVCTDPGIPVWGNRGCSIHVQEVLRALVRSEVDVELIAMRTGGEPPADLAAVRLHLLNNELPREPVARELACRELNLRTEELLTVQGPFDAVYERYSLWSYAGVEFARRVGIPGLLEVNSRLAQEQATHRVLVDHEAAVATTRRAFHAASAVLCVSEVVANYVLDFGVERECVHTMPNAVNPTKFADCTTRPGALKSDGFTVGFVGTLKPWHGVDRLIAAYARLWKRESDWRLRIVGDGPDRERLESIARALPSQIAASVEFVGMIPHTEVPSELAKFDVAVAPGVSSEDYFSPMKIFEYMAAGRPIVAARVGQTPTIIEHGITGLLYNPDDPVELARSILELRASPAKAARLGDAARQEVISRHTWDHRRDSILQIIRSLSAAPAAVAS
jgi:glycosyltransferase involved in cell wall biosynthesis